MSVAGVPVCVRAACTRTEGVELAQLPDGQVKPLCATCVREFTDNSAIEAAILAKMKAARRLDVRVRALAGPAANIRECDDAGDRLAAATTEVGRVIRAWLEAPRGQGRPS